MEPRVHVDAGFVLGQGHVVCEDYALAGHDDAGQPWAIVCDGCSSVRHSDVGARLLAHAAAMALREAHDVAMDLPGIVAAARAAARVIGLPDASLEATLLWARAHAGGLELGMCGDGLIGVHRIDGWQWWQLEHPEGAPVYPAVVVDAERRASHRATFGDAASLHRIEGSACDTDHRRPFDAPLVLQIDWAEADAVLLGSDGLVALHELGRPLDDRRLEVAAIERHVADFASLQGRFVTRRLRRLVRSAADLDLALPDDIAVAALCWGDVR